MTAMIASLLMNSARIELSKHRVRPGTRLIFIGSVLASLLTANPSFAANELCEKLRSFEHTPLAKLPDGDLQRRWMDFSWGPPENLGENKVQIGATLKCSGSDDAAKALCQYAAAHSSHETITALPLSMLRCFGFVSGPNTFPRRWIEDLEWDAPTDLIERFEIDQFVRPGHVPAMRLTLMPYPESPLAKTPEPFFKALSAKLDPSDEGVD